MEISLDGKRAFITAGGAGMDRATALAMDVARITRGEWDVKSGFY